MAFHSKMQKGDKGVLTDPNMTVLELLRTVGEIYIPTSDTVYVLRQEVPSKTRDETFFIQEVEMVDLPLMGETVWKGYQWGTFIKHLGEILAVEERKQ